MPVNSDLTEAQVREFFTTLSNWGKWGPNDQFGALNYITPAERAQAAALVREGVSVSMSLPLATRPSPDNPTPVTHLMLQTGAPGEMEMVPLPYFGQRRDLRGRSQRCHRRAQGRDRLTRGADRCAPRQRPRVAGAG